MLTGNALSTDTSLSDDNDGYDEKKRTYNRKRFLLKPVQVQRQQRTNKSFRYNGNNARTSRLFVFIYRMACFIRILYICLFFDDLVSDMYQVTTQYLSHLQLYIFFYFINKIYMMLGSRFLGTLVILVIAYKCLFEKWWFT